MLTAHPSLGSSTAADSDPCAWPSNCVCRQPQVRTPPGADTRRCRRPKVQSVKAVSERCGGGRTRAAAVWRVGSRSWRIHRRPAKGVKYTVWGGAWDMLWSPQPERRAVSYMAYRMGSIVVWSMTPGRAARCMSHSVGSSMGDTSVPPNVNMQLLQHIQRFASCNVDSVSPSPSVRTGPRPD